MLPPEAAWLTRAPVAGMADTAAGGGVADPAARGGVANTAASRAEQVRLLFDEKAATWSAKYAAEGRLTARLAQFEQCLAHHVPAGGRVLDLGCGTGDVARAADAAGLRVTACDISPEMLRRATSGGRGGAVDWVALEPQWRTLPFEPATFDAVVAASVLEYVDQPLAVLTECARVLRPSGVMLCTVPDLTHPVRWLEWLASRAVRVPSVRAGTGHWPRLDRYATYLQISKQRRPADWWCAIAAQAGLVMVPSSVAAAGHPPLRLLTFHRPSAADGKP
jgi:SAM-dependent methyltransferase